MSAVELLLSQPVLMESLRKSLMGNYSVILSLLGCLDHGIATKKLVDRAIDSCEISFFVTLEISVCGEILMN